MPSCSLNATSQKKAQWREGNRFRVNKSNEIPMTPLNDWNSYHGNSFIVVSTPPTILDPSCFPQYWVDGKSLIVNVFGQQTRNSSPSWPHCELRKSICCANVISVLTSLCNGRHCRNATQLPFLLSGVLHGFSVHFIYDWLIRLEIEKKKNCIRLQIMLMEWNLFPKFSNSSEYHWENRFSMRRVWLNMEKPMVLGIYLVKKIWSFFTTKLGMIWIITDRKWVWAANKNIVTVTTTLWIPQKCLLLRCYIFPHESE